MGSKINLTNETSTEVIAQYLFNYNIISKPPDTASTEKPGEGNMNLVLRFRYDDESLIIKQSKPFVNKYPTIPAPEERIDTEAKYYQYLSDYPVLQQMMPTVYYYDPSNHLMVLEDLGESKDFLFVYQKDKQLTPTELEALVGYLSQLHSIDWTAERITNFPDNLKLRQLNHQHIFDLPFRENNGFDLDGIHKGLHHVSMKYRQCQKLKEVTHQLGEVYLSAGTTLIHGDYYPGSWVRSDSGIQIIDPEFSFMGQPEIELGIFSAHLRMSGYSFNSIFTLLDQQYTCEYNLTKVQKFAAVEIMRRIIGIAQLPLEKTLEEKADLLAEAYDILIA